MDEAGMDGIPTNEAIMVKDSAIEALKAEAWERRKAALKKIGLGLMTTTTGEAALIMAIPMKLMIESDQSNPMSLIVKGLLVSLMAAGSIGVWKGAREVGSGVGTLIDPNKQEVGNEEGAVTKDLASLVQETVNGN